MIEFKNLDSIGLTESQLTYGLFLFLLLLSIAIDELTITNVLKRDKRQILKALAEIIEDKRKHLKPFKQKKTKLLLVYAKMEKYNDKTL